VLTSFLLSLLQTVLTTTVTRNVIAPLAKTIATANEVIVGIGIGTVAGENERTVTATLTATGNAPIAATAKGTAIGTATEIANAAAIAKKDALATRKNADEIFRAKTTDAGHTLAAMKREAPHAVPAAAAAASVTAAHQIAARQHPWEPSRSHSANARPVAGTSMHQVTISTRLCRRSKPVRITFRSKTKCVD